MTKPSVIELVKRSAQAAGEAHTWTYDDHASLLGCLRRISGWMEETDGEGCVPGFLSNAIFEGEQKA